jgi:hypothetical protein
MLKLGDILCLRAEADQVGVRGMTPVEEHLEGHEAVQPRLPRLVDDSHAATPNLCEDLITRDGRHIIKCWVPGCLWQRDRESIASGLRRRARGRRRPQRRPRLPGKLITEPGGVEFGEAREIVGAAVVDVQWHQLAQQRRPLASLPASDEVLQGRRSAGAPGGLEAVAHRVDPAGQRQ